MILNSQFEHLVEKSCLGCRLLDALMSKLITFNKIRLCILLKNLRQSSCTFKNLKTMGKAMCLSEPKTARGRERGGQEFDGRSPPTLAKLYDVSSCLPLVLYFPSQSWDRPSPFPDVAIATYGPQNPWVTQCLFIRVR